MAFITLFSVDLCLLLIYLLTQDIQTKHFIASLSDSFFFFFLCLILSLTGGTAFTLFFRTRHRNHHYLLSLAYDTYIVP